MLVSVRRSDGLELEGELVRQNDDGTWLCDFFDGTHCPNVRSEDIVSKRDVDEREVVERDVVERDVDERVKSNKGVRKRSRPNDEMWHAYTPNRFETDSMAFCPDGIPKILLRNVYDNRHFVSVKDKQPLEPLTPYNKKRFTQNTNIPHDGDCFYHSVIDCLEEAQGERLKEMLSEADRLPTKATTASMKNSTRLRMYLLDRLNDDHRPRWMSASANDIDNIIHRLRLRLATGIPRKISWSQLDASDVGKFFEAKTPYALWREEPPCYLCLQTKPHETYQVGHKYEVTSVSNPNVILKPSPSEKAVMKAEDIIGLRVSVAGDTIVSPFSRFHEDAPAFGIFTVANVFQSDQLKKNFRQIEAEVEKDVVRLEGKGLVFDRMQMDTYRVWVRSPNDVRVRFGTLPPTDFQVTGMQGHHSDFEIYKDDMTGQQVVDVTDDKVTLQNGISFGNVQEDYSLRFSNEGLMKVTNVGLPDRAKVIPYAGWAQSEEIYMLSNVIPACIGVSVNSEI